MREINFYNEKIEYKICSVCKKGFPATTDYFHKNPVCAKIVLMRERRGAMQKEMKSQSGSLKTQEGKGKRKPGEKQKKLGWKG